MTNPEIPLGWCQDLLEHIPQGILIARKGGFLQFANRHVRDLTGLRESELVGWSWLRVIHPQEAETILNHWVEGTLLEERFEFRCRIHAADHSYRWCHFQAEPYRGGEGAVQMWVVSCTDAQERSEHKEMFFAASREVRELTALLDSLLERLPVGVGVVGRDLRFLRANPALASLDGVAVGEHLGRTIAQVLPEFSSGLEPAVRRVFATGAAEMEREFVGSSPQNPRVACHWCASFYPVLFDGELHAVGIIVEEITDQSARDADTAELRTEISRLRALLNKADAVGDE